MKNPVRPYEVAVVGGGIAAFAARAALREAGVSVVAFVGREPPIAPERLLVCPRLQRGDSFQARFLRDAYREACAFYERSPHDEAIVARGALRVAQNAQEQIRLRALAQELPHLCRWLEAREAQGESGLLAQATRWGGVFLPDALVLEPKKLLGGLSADNEMTFRGDIERMERGGDGGWRMTTEAGKAAGEVVMAEAVVLALGAQLPTFLRERVSFYSEDELENLLVALQVGMGRIDICDGAVLSNAPRLAVCGSGWVMPFSGGRVGVVRGVALSRASEGWGENRKRLVEWCGLSANDSADEMSFELSYGALRLSTRDRLPLLGEVLGNGGGRSSCLFLLGGLGGHGFLTAPLCGGLLGGVLGRGGGGTGLLSLLSPRRFLRVVHK